MKDFHIGDILSITTGRLVSPTHMDGIYAILNYMTNDDLFTHQLPRAMQECTPYLLEQYPQLANVDANEVNEENLQKWLAEQATRFGEFLPVAPIQTTEYKAIDPIVEAMDLVGNNKVIVVNITESER